MVLVLLPDIYCILVFKLHYNIDSWLLKFSLHFVLVVRSSDLPPLEMFSGKIMPSSQHLLRNRVRSFSGKLDYAGSVESKYLSRTIPRSQSTWQMLQWGTYVFYNPTCQATKWQPEAQARFSPTLGKDNKIFLHPLRSAACHLQIGLCQWCHLGAGSILKLHYFWLFLTKGWIFIFPWGPRGKVLLPLKSMGVEGVPHASGGAQFLEGLQNKLDMRWQSQLSYKGMLRESCEEVVGLIVCWKRRGGSE